MPFTSIIGRTLARGGVAVGMALGGFFGVTEESQPGWREVQQRRAEVSLYFDLTHSSNVSSLTGQLSDTGS